MTDSLNIYDILLFSTPFDLRVYIFYQEIERLITNTQNIDIETLRLHDVILQKINDSLLSDSNGTQTWLLNGYISNKSNLSLSNERYLLKNINFVRLLQQVVLNTYNSIDEFYEAEGITVSPIFAEMSELAGYPISPQFIEDIS